MKGSDERLVDKGTATVKPSLKALAADAAFDGRTQAEKDLDAMRAALVPATSAGVQEYEIGGVGHVTAASATSTREDLSTLRKASRSG